MLIATFLIVSWVLPGTWTIAGKEFSSLGVFYAVIFGLVAGLGIGLITEFYTGTGTKPVRSIVEQSVT